MSWTNCHALFLLHCNFQSGSDKFFYCITESVHAYMLPVFHSETASREKCNTQDTFIRCDNSSIVTLSNATTHRPLVKHKDLSPDSSIYDHLDIFIFSLMQRHLPSLHTMDEAFLAMPYTHKIFLGFRSFRHHKIWTVTLSVRFIYLWITASHIRISIRWVKGERWLLVCPQEINIWNWNALNSSGWSQANSSARMVTPWNQLWTHVVGATLRAVPALSSSVPCAMDRCLQVNTGSGKDENIWFTDFNQSKTYLDQNCHFIAWESKETFLYAKMLGKI